MISMLHRKHIIVSASVLQYHINIRQIQLMITVYKVQSFPFDEHSMRAYRKWQEYNYPVTSVRCGLTAEVMIQLWALRIHTTSSIMLRDFSTVSFAFSINGLAI